MRTSRHYLPGRKWLHVFLARHVPQNRDLSRNPDFELLANWLVVVEGEGTVPGEGPGRKLGSKASPILRGPNKCI
jgi:hypothetical protein